MLPGSGCGLAEEMRWDESGPLSRLLAQLVGKIQLKDKEREQRQVGETSTS